MQPNKLDEVKEGSSCIITASFFDEDDVAVVPTAAYYQIDDVRSNTNILALTVLTGLSTTKKIVVTRAQNAILDQTNSSERRVLTVAFTYMNSDGLTLTGADEYEYSLINLLATIDLPSASPSVSLSASASPSATT